MIYDELYILQESTNNDEAKQLLISQKMALQARVSEVENQLKKVLKAVNNTCLYVLYPSLLLF